MIATVVFLEMLPRERHVMFLNCLEIYLFLVMICPFLEGQSHQSKVDFCIDKLINEFLNG